MDLNKNREPIEILEKTLNFQVFDRVAFNKKHKIRVKF